MSAVLSRVATILAVSVLCGTAIADGYTPDVLELDGETTLRFEPAAQLDLADGGTLEFWVSPDWDADPGYDPVVLCNAGADGIAYLVAILGDRDGLLFAAGEQSDVFPYDFSDAQMHHVAIQQLEDGIAVLVDGVVIGTSDVMAARIESDGLWVGSLDGYNEPFAGAVAGLRFWDEVLERETLIEYAMKDAIFDEHPDIEWLAAVSDFDVGELALITEEPESIPEAALVDGQGDER